jgi:hypothetical protein
MAIADVGPALTRPERVVDFGAGRRPNHQGDGNALTPATLGSTPPVAHPYAPPGSETGPPISAVIVAVRPVTMVDAETAVLPTTTTAPSVHQPGTTTTPTVPPAIDLPEPDPAPTRPPHMHVPHRPHRPHDAHTPKPHHVPRPKHVPKPKHVPEPKHEQKTKKAKKTTS